MADSDIPFVFRSFKYRLLPTRKQHAALAEILEAQRQLYNGALEHRVEAWRKGRKNITINIQQKELTELRKIEEFAAIPVRIQRWTLRRVDEAYTSFFRRLKAGEKPGFPRFRGKGRWRSFGFADCDGIRISGRRIRFKGLPGSMRIHLHRSPPDVRPRSCAFSRDEKGWTVSFQYRLPISPLPKIGHHVGIDFGLKQLCVFSNGESVPNVRLAKRAERELRRKQRALSRCEKGSRRCRKVRYDLARCFSRVRQARHTYLHQISARIVRENDIIAVERIAFEGLAKGMLSKSVHDAAWSLLKQMIAYKAESAGRQLIEVDPRNTTQACSGCGVIVPKKLSERWHCCPHCGLEMDRDHNAAINILHRAVLRPEFAKSCTTSI